MSFVDRYGPWAVIAGASEGTGREFARQLAAKGMNCLLIARREAPLLELAQSIRNDSGVECAIATIDLTGVDAFDRIMDAVGEREVGLYISNAGADPNGSAFLDKDVQSWIDLLNRNVVTSLRCCHHFGQAMRQRGRGGLLLVGSAACYGSGPSLATYSGVKAFDLCFAEGLWAELAPFGVDVLYLVMSTTDTPALRELLSHKGLPLPANLAAPSDVATLGLDRLPHGPVANFGLEEDQVGWAVSSAGQRRARVERVAASSKAVLGEHQQ